MPTSNVWPHLIWDFCCKKPHNSVLLCPQLDTTGMAMNSLDEPRSSCFCINVCEPFISILMQSLRSALCDHWLYDLVSCLNHLYPQHSHKLESEPSTLSICALETFFILLDDLWISAIRLKGVKELKVERWKSKAARGWLLTLTVSQG